MRPANPCFLAFLFTLVVCSSTVAQNIRGNWDLKSCTINGQEISADQVNGMKLNFTYSNFTATAGDRKSSGKVKQETRQTPFKMTFTIEDGDDAGRELKAIYERAGTGLKIAFSRSGEYPTSFDSTPSNQYAVMNYAFVRPKSKGQMTAEERRVPQSSNRDSWHVRWRWLVQVALDCSVPGIEFSGKN